MMQAAGDKASTCLSPESKALWAARADLAAECARAGWALLLLRSEAEGPLHTPALFSQHAHPKAEQTEAPGAPPLT